MKRRIRLPESIVVGIDNTPDLEHPVRAGLELSSRFGASLAIVHVLPAMPSIYASIPTEPLTRAEREAEARVQDEVRRRVAKVLDAAGRDPSDLTDLLVFARGASAPALIAEAEDRGADLILVGRHHKKGAFDFGRTLRGVLAHAPRAVWLQPDAPKPIRRILCPVDLSEPSLDALALARELAKSLGASLEALHAFAEVPFDGLYAEYAALQATYTLDELRKANKEAFETAMAEFDWGGVEHRASFVEGDPVEVVSEREGDFDLVVLSTHGRSGLKGLVLGNVAYSVLKRARVPVLALRRG
jgi:nucleotide-binding universal stress UspA family protein